MPCDAQDSCSSEHFVASSNGRSSIVISFNTDTRAKRLSKSCGTVVDAARPGWPTEGLEGSSTASNQIEVLAWASGALLRERGYHVI